MCFISFQFKAQTSYWTSICEQRLAILDSQSNCLLFLREKAYIRTTDERGTPGYIAPEYQRGQLGPKVDVFALGVVSWEDDLYCGSITACLEPPGNLGGILGTEGV